MGQGYRTKIQLWLRRTLVRYSFIEHSKIKEPHPKRDGAVICTPKKIIMFLLHFTEVCTKITMPIIKRRKTINTLQAYDPADA